MITSISNEITIKLASALLLQNKELSLDDIRAIPFLENAQDAGFIVEALSKIFDTEIYQRRIPSSSVPQWEEIIRLKR